MSCSCLCVCVCVCVCVPVCKLVSASYVLRLPNLFSMLGVGGCGIEDRLVPHPVLKFDSCTCNLHVCTIQIVATYNIPYITSLNMQAYHNCTLLSNSIYGSECIHVRV